MREKPLSDQQIKQLAAHWWAQHDKPIEPAPGPLKLVPYSALASSGPGHIISAAIKEELRTNGYSEEVAFVVARHRRCMNCGERMATDEEWCSGCNGDSSYDEESARKATEIIRGWKSETTRREEAWAEAYLSARRLQRKVHMAGRPGHPAKVEEAELVQTRGK